jgi:hypothetical protein
MIMMEFFQFCELKKLAIFAPKTTTLVKIVLRKQICPKFSSKTHHPIKQTLITHCCKEPMIKNSI